METKVKPVETKKDESIIGQEGVEAFKKGLPPQEGLDIPAVKNTSDTPKTNEETAKERTELANKLVSFIDSQKKEAVKIMSLKEKIMQNLGTIAGGESNVYNFFSTVSKNVESWTKFGELENPSIEDIKKVIEEAKKDNFKGNVTTDKEKKLVYVNKKNASWSNEKAQV